MRARYYNSDLMRFINEDIVTGDMPSLSAQEFKNGRLNENDDKTSIDDLTLIFMTHYERPGTGYSIDERIKNAYEWNNRLLEAGYN